MNISLKGSCIILDLVMAAIFFLIGFLFYRSNGKAANFLSGYNMKSAEERKKYDEKKMCKDYGKHIMRWPIPFFIGAVIDFVFPIKGTLIAWVIWSGMFFLLLIERHKRER
jgi:hypothetical protein